MQVAPAQSGRGAAHGSAVSTPFGQIFQLRGENYKSGFLHLYVCVVSWYLSLAY